MQGGRFGAGDGLRALAALAVVGFHAAVIASAAAAGHASGPVWAVASHLDLGLYVFFVLSGYLIARPFARSLVTGAPGPRLRRYATHRLRRIVPAFWAALLITLAVAGAGGAGVLTAFLFAGTWPTLPQAWTLDAEMGFYLLLPVVAALAALVARRLPSPRARAVTLLCGLVAVAVLSLIARQAAGQVTDPLARSLPALLFAFAPGVALALVEPLVPARVFAWARPAGIAIGVAGVGLCALAAVHGMAGAVGGALVAAGAGAIVAGPLVRQWAGGGTGPVLGSRPLRWLGERSYSLYLLHFLVLAELAPVAHGRLVVLVALGAPASIVAAALLYQLVERPFMTRPASAPAPLPTAAPAPRVGGA